MGTTRTGARSAMSCNASTATPSTPSTRRLTTPGANDAALKKVSACTGPLAAQARCALRAGPLALQALAARGWVRLPNKLGCMQLGPLAIQAWCARRAGPLAPQAWPHAAGSACPASFDRTRSGPLALQAVWPHAAGSACPASFDRTRSGPLALQAVWPLRGWVRLPCKPHFPPSLPAATGQWLQRRQRGAASEGAFTQGGSAKRGLRLARPPSCLAREWKLKPSTTDRTERGGSVCKG
jgi:hypothetical protein